MAHEGDHGGYLTDEATVDTVYGLIKKGDIAGATAYLKGLGDDKAIVNAWIGVQCDINNTRHDPDASAAAAEPGIAYCLEKGYKKPAAMMLHNIAAFYMPNFDEGVSQEAAAKAVDAARRQLPLRREIGEPMAWTMWDLGVAELCAGNAEAAVSALHTGAEMAREAEDADAEAWCNLFCGKAMVKLVPEQRDEGAEMMRSAAKVIMDVGADWEKEETLKILKSAGLE